MSSLYRTACSFGLIVLLLGLGAAPAPAAPQLGLELARDSAPTSTPVTESDERVVYEVTVKNTADNSPKVDDTLTCETDASKWSGIPDDSALSFRWLRNGVEIPGEEAKTYVVGAADEGQALQCKVMGTNPNARAVAAAGRGASTKGSTVITSVTTSHGTFAVGQFFSGTGIPDGTTIVAVGAGTLELSAAATLSSSDESVILGVAPASFSVSAAAVSLPPVVVNPQPATPPPLPTEDPRVVESRPSVVGAVSGSGFSSDGEKLICKAPTNWTPEDAAFSYQWLRNGAPIAGETSSEYTPVESEDKLAVLQCEVKAASGSGIPPSGGVAVNISKSVLWVVTGPVNFFALDSTGLTPGVGQVPALGFANTLSGPVDLDVELPAGQETYAMVVELPPETKWSCDKQAPTLVQRATVTCTRDDPLPPGASYPLIEIIGHVGNDAPDPLVAKASVSGGGTSASDQDVVDLLPAVPFGFKAFSTKLADQDGKDFTVAGGHPFSAGADLEFNDHVPALPSGAGLRATNGYVRQVLTKVPRGFFGNLLAVKETCPAIRDVTEGTCPPGSVIGGITLETELTTFPDVPIYSMEPERGTVAQFGFGLSEPEVAYVIAPELHAEDGYAVSIASAPAPKSPELFGAEVTLCGFGAKFQAVPTAFKGCRKFNEAGASSVPFLTNPTRCTSVPPTTVIAADSWEHPGEYAEAKSENPPLQGCDQVEFGVDEASLQPTSVRADSASGLDVEIALPTAGLESPTGIAQANMARSVVTLPEGMTLNPTAGEGLGACTSAQIGLGKDDKPTCPDSSKVGTLEVKTPLLEEALPGSIYIAKQGDNPFGSLLALYLVVESERYGLRVKVPGKVVADPQTGRLTTIFNEVPEAPVSSLTLHLNSGERAPLLTPPKCGSYSVRSEFSPWTAADPSNPTSAEIVVKSSPFKISRGPGGGACPPGNLEPKLAARLANPIAGASSPFTLRLNRDDGTQRFKAVDFTMPPGLTAYLKDIPSCPDSVLGSISGVEGTGAGELASPACPAASQIGSVSVGVGAGANPFYVNTARIYLAGPYKGAPLSIAVVAPAVAGPFDLGSVVVRSAAYVDRQTARITLKSDPIPTILHGIPLDVRDIRVNVDRPDFILAPTTCEASSLDAQVLGESATAAVSDRFQVGNCGALAYKPKLALKLKGGTKRNDNPALTAILTQHPGQANTARLSVAFPHSEFLDQSHIGTVCTRVQFAAAQCPKGSIYGSAEVFTPLLSEKLTGKVYLRSSSNPLPDLVMALEGPPSRPVQVDLVGRIDSVNGGIRSTFDVVPDAPVSRAVVRMRGGKKGLLVNSRDICAKPGYATLRMTAHSGKTRNARTLVQGECRKGKKKGSRQGKKSR